MVLRFNAQACRRVALVEHFIGLHGGMDRGFGAVLVDEELGGAEDVEVGDGH